MLYAIAYLVSCLVACLSYLWLIHKDICWPHFVGWLLCLFPVVNVVWTLLMAFEASRDLWRRI